MTKRISLKKEELDYLVALVEKDISSLIDPRTTLLNYVQNELISKLYSAYDDDEETE